MLPWLRRLANEFWGKWKTTWLNWTNFFLLLLYRSWSVFYFFQFDLKATTYAIATFFLIFCEVISALLNAIKAGKREERTCGSDTNEGSINKLYTRTTHEFFENHSLLFVVECNFSASPSLSIKALISLCEAVRQGEKKTRLENPWEKEKLFPLHELSNVCIIF